MEPRVALRCCENAVLCKSHHSEKTSNKLCCVRQGPCSLWAMRAFSCQMYQTIWVVNHVSAVTCSPEKWGCMQQPRRCRHLIWTFGRSTCTCCYISHLCPLSSFQTAVDQLKGSFCFRNGILRRIECFTCCRFGERKNVVHIFFSFFLALDCSYFFFRLLLCIFMQLPWRRYTTFFFLPWFWLCDRLSPLFFF